MVRALCLAVVCSVASPASALTPDELLAALSGTGPVTLTSRGESRTGDTLRLSDARLRYVEAGTDVFWEWEWLELSGAPDGVVTVTASPRGSLGGSLAEGDGTRTEVRGTLGQEGAVALIAGAGNAGQVALAADVIDLQVTVGPVSGRPVTGGLTARGVSLDGAAIWGRMMTGKLRARADSLRLAANSTDPVVPFSLSAELTAPLADLSGSALGDAPDPETMQRGDGSARLEADSIAVSVRARDPEGGEDISLAYTLVDGRAGFTADLGRVPSDGTNPRMSLAGSLSLGLVDMLMSAESPAGGAGLGSGNARSEDMALAFRATVPESIEAMEFDKAISRGLSLSLEGTSGPGQSAFDIADPEFTGRIETSGEMARLDFALDAQGIAYGVSQTGMRVRVESPAFPEPMEATTAEITFRAEAPARPSPTAQPYALLLRLADVSLSESIWALFDPEATLPRGAARLILDIGGVTQVAENAFATDGTAPEQPFMPQSVDIRAAEFVFGGAEVKGSGAFDLQLEASPPQASGRFDMTMNGVYALLGRLGSLGMPTEAMLGIRGVIAMIGKPVGPDQLTTTIEARPGGIYANGTRLPLD